MKQQVQSSPACWADAAAESSLPLLLCLAASSEAPPRAERRLAAHSYQEVALTDADAAADDRFGWSVAIDGDTVVVGAYDKDGQTGAVYVFRRATAAPRTDKLSS